MPTREPSDDDNGALMNVKNERMPTHLMIRDSIHTFIRLATQRDR